jgi:hypothetical protein
MKLLIKAGDKLVHKSMFFTYSCSYQVHVFNYISTTPTHITKYLSTEQILHQPSHKLSSGKLNTQHNHIPDSQAALEITAKIKTLLLKSKT